MFIGINTRKARYMLHKGNTKDIRCYFFAIWQMLLHIREKKLNDFIRGQKNTIYLSTGVYFSIWRN
jgi:hypothetical protein